MRELERVEAPREPRMGPEGLLSLQGRERIASVRSEKAASEKGNETLQIDSRMVAS